MKNKNALGALALSLAMIQANAVVMLSSVKVYGELDN